MTISPIFRHLSTLLLCLAGASALHAGNVQLSGSSQKIIEVQPEKSTGLDRIYVVYNTEGVAASYTATSDATVTWYRYSSLGGGFAEEISGIERNGRVTTLQQVYGDMGYIIDEGTQRTFFWITDYSKHALMLRSASVSAESDCSMAVVNVNGSGDPIHYYTINGQQKTLDQHIETTYYTLQYDDNSKTYNQIEATHTSESLSENIYISPAPLCDTRFTVTGDCFQKQWGSYNQARTDSWKTPAVECMTYAEQVPHTSGDDPSNEIGSSDEEGLGGSAPADITFCSVTTDAVIHYEWQFASDPEFTNLTYRFNDKNINYVFREEGTTYVRFVGSNDDGSCETYGETYTVHIGASELKVPNAFSPGASEGVNDIWKVSYRSIVEFECHIFDGRGSEICSFNDPAGGWDGKRRGKFVKPGVYYYVIEALGAEGKKYKLAGDINILRHVVKAGSSVVNPE